MCNLFPYKNHHYRSKYPIVLLQERCEIAFKFYWLICVKVGVTIFCRFHAVPCSFVKKMVWSLFWLWLKHTPKRTHAQKTSPKFDLAEKNPKITRFLYLSNIWHQIIWNVLRIFTNLSGWVSAHGIKISQQYSIQILKIRELLFFKYLNFRTDGYLLY